MNKAPRVRRANKVTLVLQVLQVLQDLQVLPVQRDPLDPPARRGKPDLWAQQANQARSDPRVPWDPPAKRERSVRKATPVTPAPRVLRE